MNDLYEVLVYYIATFPKDKLEAVHDIYKEVFFDDSNANKGTNVEELMRTNRAVYACIVNLKMFSTTSMCNMDEAYGIHSILLRIHKQIPDPAEFISFCCGARQGHAGCQVYDELSRCVLV